jgi:hypothetical protein
MQSRRCGYLELMYVPEQQGKQKVNRVVSNMLPILSPNDLTIKYTPSIRIYLDLSR